MLEDDLVNSVESVLDHTPTITVLESAVFSIEIREHSNQSCWYWRILTAGFIVGHGSAGTKNRAIIDAVEYQDNVSSEYWEQV